MAASADFTAVSNHIYKYSSSRSLFPRVESVILLEDSNLIANFLTAVYGERLVRSSPVAAP